MLIGLLGLKGSGKDTAASHLIEQHGFHRVAFADALYQQVADAYDVSVSFLGNRETKELPLPELALHNCSNKEFVDVVLSHLFAKDPGADKDQLLSEPRSPRFTLQYWGTEYRRKHCGPDSYWRDIVSAQISENPAQRWVVTDLRFLNEYDLVKELGGSTIRIRRPAIETALVNERDNGGDASHSSETELLHVNTDYVLTNAENDPGAMFAILDKTLFG